MTSKITKLFVGGVTATVLGAGGVGLALAATQNTDDGFAQSFSNATYSSDDTMYDNLGPDDIGKEIEPGVVYGGNEMPTPEEIISNCAASIESDDVGEMCTLINAMPELAYDLDALESEMSIDYGNLGPEDIGKEIAPGVIYGGK